MRDLLQETVKYVQNVKYILIISSLIDSLSDVRLFHYVLGVKLFLVKHLKFCSSIFLLIKKHFELLYLSKFISIIELALDCIFKSLCLRGSHFENNQL